MEHEECAYCGFTVEYPCESPPPDYCDTAIVQQLRDRYVDPDTTRPPVDERAKQELGFGFNNEYDRDAS